MSTGVGVNGSTSSHGGTMITASGSHIQTPQGAVCINGDSHSCPITGHGITAVAGNSTRSVVNGMTVVLNGAVAGCGAVINGGFASNVVLS